MNFRQETKSKTSRNTIENNIICTTEEFFNTEFSMEVKVYVDQIVNFNFKSINKVSKIIKEIQKKLGIIKKFMKNYLHRECCNIGLLQN